MLPCPPAWSTRNLDTRPDAARGTSLSTGFRAPIYFSTLRLLSGIEDTQENNRARYHATGIRRPPLVAPVPSIEITRCRWSPRVRARTVSSAERTNERTNGQRGRNSRNQIHLAGSRDVSLLHGYLTEWNRGDERRGSTLVVNDGWSRRWKSFATHSCGPRSNVSSLTRGRVLTFSGTVFVCPPPGMRSRHQPRRPRERSNLNIATCFLRRSRKIWGERDGHFEGP